MGYTIIYRHKEKRVLIANNTHEARRNTHVMLSTVKNVEVVAITLDCGIDKEAVRSSNKPLNSRIMNCLDANSRYDLRRPQALG